LWQWLLSSAKLLRNRVNRNLLRIHSMSKQNSQFFGYLKATLEAIAAGHPAAKIDELLPWNFQKST